MSMIYPLGNLIKKKSTFKTWQPCQEECKVQRSLSLAPVKAESEGVVEKLVISNVASTAAWLLVWQSVGRVLFAVIFVGSLKQGLQGPGAIQVIPQLSRQCSEVLRVTPAAVISLEGIQWYLGMPRAIPGLGACSGRD